MKFKKGDKVTVKDNGDNFLLFIYSEELGEIVDTEGGITVLLENGTSLKMSKQEAEDYLELTFKFEVGEKVEVFDEVVKITDRKVSKDYMGFNIATYAIDLKKDIWFSEVFLKKIPGDKIKIEESKREDFKVGDEVKIIIQL